jgi:hypothetical protein
MSREHNFVLDIFTIIFLANASLALHHKPLLYAKFLAEDTAEQATDSSYAASHRFLSWRGSTFYITIIPFPL